MGASGLVKQLCPPGGTPGKLPGRSPGNFMLQGLQECDQVGNIFLRRWIVHCHGGMQGCLNLVGKGLEPPIPGPGAGKRYAVKVWRFLGKAISVCLGVEGMASGASLGVTAVATVPPSP